MLQSLVDGGSTSSEEDFFSLNGKLRSAAPDVFPSRPLSLDCGGSKERALETRKKRELERKRNSKSEKDQGNT